MLMPDLVLQIADARDARAIAQMSRDLIETGLGWSWTPARVGAAIRHPEVLVVTARKDERIIGFGIMEFGDETAHLSLFAVLPQFQRHGVGREMFEWLRTSALTAGIAAIKLELRVENSAAQCFYHSFGFEKVGLTAGYYRGRETALRMLLNLRQHSRGHQAH